MSVPTRQKAIRQRCHGCAGGCKEVRECSFEDCSLHPFRMGKRPPKEGRGDTAKKAIRKHCLWCVNGQVIEVRYCPSIDCPLWSYRMGIKINSKGKKPPVFDVFSEEQEKGGTQVSMSDINCKNIPFNNKQEAQETLLNNEMENSEENACV